jgi:LmbE family N-acetylglucosaminyl deacetylase
MNVLVIAAHPDDEVLGMGATIRKHTKKGNKVHLCVVTEGATAQYRNKKMIEVRKKACIVSCKILGISSFDFLEFSDMQLDSIPQLKINKQLESIVSKIKPDIVYTTPHNDLNKDHQIVFESTLVATRPSSNKVKQILCYEIPNIIMKPFNPNLFENVSKEFSYKIKAFQVYKSEVEKFPHPRSIKSIESLATQRGIQAGVQKAEAFELIKCINY